MVFAILVDLFHFSKIGQNGRPGGQEPPQSTSFDETKRMVWVWGRRRKVIFVLFTIVRGVSCVLLGPTEAARMGNFTLARKMCHDISLDTQWRAKRVIVYASNSHGKFCGPA